MQAPKLAFDRDLERLTERAHRYLRQVPPIPASRDWDASKRCYLVCLGVVRNFRGLSMDDVWLAIQTWNHRCSPSWPEETLRRKVRDACRWVASQKPGRL